MATALTEAQQAQQAWHQALKLRKHLSKQIEKLRADSASGTDIAQFEAIDESLEQLRFACVTTIFLDFELAASESTEELLWQLHSTINGEYRRILTKLRQDSRVVEKRKVETKYGHFLRIAQKFYKGYIQRLSARYDIDELKRVARGIEVEEMQAKVVISPVPDRLHKMVLNSCHSTLIRLGDLARYRVQAKHKKSYDMALAFYSLGHDLMPDSGFAFHQMGIVNIEEGNHLDVVYHFYRAWAVEKPHPMAKQNLEAKFKSLANQNAIQRSKASSSSAHEAFVLWFLRLHALFYKGDPISAQHHELEREVMHRLAMAAKDPTCAHILLKMALVNMSASCIASAQYDESKTEPASRFYHYTLHFNARFVLKLCEIIDASLRDSVAVQSVDAETQDEPSAKTALLTSLLPVLRIYCMWIATCRSEILGSPDATGNVIPPMIQSLAKVLTLLCTEVYSMPGSPESCPYLLPEDIEIRGLKVFNEDRVPAACKGYCTENGELKPHPDSPMQRFDPSLESMARILDILRCAYFLAGDPVLPIAWVVVDNQLVFQYAPGDDDHGAVASNSQTIQGSVKSPVQTPAGAPGKANGFDQVQSHVAKPQKEKVQPRSPNVPQQSAVPVVAEHLDTDSFDETVANVLSPFIDCPSPKPEQHPRSPDEPSYGMHSATANEVAQELLMSFQRETTKEPAPYYESFNPGNFGSSTWNSYFTPTTPKASDPAAAVTTGVPAHQRHSYNSSRGSGPAVEASGDPFVTPGRVGAGNLQPPQANRTAGSPRASNGGLQSGQQAFQAFGGAMWGARSPSESWTQNHKQTPIGQRPGVSTRPSHYPPAFPTSSDVSAFSHPSSLYQGTPAANGVNQWSHVYGNMGAVQPLNGVPQQNRPTSSPHLQMEETASSYDAAIFQGALKGNK